MKTKYLGVMGILLMISGCGTTVDLGEATTITDTPTSTTTTVTNNESPLPTQAYDVPAIDASLKQSYLDAINTARAVSRDCGSEGYKNAVSALAWSDELYRSAYEHSQDLALTNTFQHTGSNTNSDWTSQSLNLGTGSGLTDRVSRSGYNWTNVGENIAAGRETAQQAVNAWIESDGHCANLMSSSFTEVGLALFVYSNSTYQTYWTQTFGNR